MTARPVAVRLDERIELRLYDGEVLTLTVPLEPRRALLLGLDLIDHTTAGELTLEQAAPVLRGVDRYGPWPLAGTAEKKPARQEVHAPRAGINPPAEAGSQEDLIDDEECRADYP